MVHLGIWGGFDLGSHWSKIGRSYVWLFGVPLHGLGLPILMGRCLWLGFPQGLQGLQFGAWGFLIQSYDLGSPGVLT